MRALLPQPQCRQLVAEFFGRTHGGRERNSKVLQDLIERVYAQGYQKGLQDAKSEVHPAD
jgi:hypothetical protein